MALAFSGGGTRAAAFSYGVLRQLDRDTITVAAGKRTMLDLVDVISSVSGGSFTAAYYGLYGKQGFDAYEQQFLHREFKWALARTLLAPHHLIEMMSPSFGRSDVVADLWRRVLFEGKTFADIRSDGPYIVLNATDMYSGAVFSFVQELFDPMCVDLLHFPIARAVAASSAIPPTLSPVTVDAYPGTCGYSLEDRFRDGLKTERGDRFYYATQVQSLSDSIERHFIHLMDGGPADNLGVRPLLRSLMSGAPDLSYRRHLTRDPQHTYRIAYIAVNAAPHTASPIDRTARTPGLLTTVFNAVGTPFDNYTRETIKSLLGSEAFTGINLNGCAQPGGAIKPRPCNDFFMAEVAFADEPDPGVRARLLELGTNYWLSHDEVDLLIKEAGQLLCANGEYLRLLRDIRRDPNASCHR